MLRRPQAGQIALPFFLLFCPFLEGSLGPWCLLGLEEGYLGLGLYILWPVVWPSPLCSDSDVPSVQWLTLRGEGWGICDSLLTLKGKTQPVLGG